MGTEASGTPAADDKKSESGYIPSDQVKLLQKLLEGQEKKRVLVLALQGKMNQGEVMIEAESKNIAKEAERRRVSLKLEMERAQEEFSRRFEQIDADEKAALAAIRRDVDLVRAAFAREQKALGNFNIQIGRELVKMGVIEISPAEQVTA